jgi:hypothetical protein
VGRNCHAARRCDGRDARHDEAAITPKLQIN